MNKYFFIHCADLHLGISPLKLEERYEDFFESFNKVLSYTIENQIRLILVSGDLFHLKNINSKTLLRTTNILEKAKKNNVDVVVIEGNHDKAFYVDEESWLNYLKEKDLIHLLTYKIVEGKVIDVDKYENENIQVFGVGYLGTATEQHISEIYKIIEEKKTNNKYCVLMLHAAIDRLISSDLASVKKEKIEMLKNVVDYLALGHIHYTYSGDDWIFNPGSLDRLRIDESDKSKGFYKVEVNGKKAEAQFIEINTRKYINKKITIDASMNEKVVEDMLKNSEYNIDEIGSVLCVNLYGRIEWNSMLINFEEIKEYLKNKYNLLYIEINNYINIYTESEDVNEIDFEQIERKELAKELQKYYPNINVNELLNQTLLLKNSLINNDDPQDILEKIYSSEVFNEN